jgi:60 kDa SS-A/Ro ribonucleoprotein
MQNIIADLGLTDGPVTRAIPGRTDMVKNNAGGFVFAATDMAQLRRFLIIGTEGGSYYKTQQQLSIQNTQALLRCARADGPAVVAEIVKISNEGRAPKNDQAIFALAVCAKLGTPALGALAGPDDANALACRQAANRALPLVCRTGTHLYQYMDVMKTFSMSAGTKRAVTRWFNDKTADTLAYQAIKYPQRRVSSGKQWSFRDVLRLVRPKVIAGSDHDNVFNYMVNGVDAVDTVAEWTENAVMAKVVAAERARRSENAKEVISLIERYNLPREVINTKLLNSPEVWDALLHAGRGMPLGALVRNLGKMTSVGLIAPLSKGLKTVEERLGNAANVISSRQHPLALLTAQMIYTQGHGNKGNLGWRPEPRVVAALESAFYSSFGSIPTTGRNTLLALDVSSSMNCGELNNVPGLTPRIVSAVMAMVTARTEPNHAFVGFSYKLINLDLTPRDSLTEVVKKISDLPFGGTNTSLPVEWAIKNKVPVDTFVTYTDNDTWAGRHTSQVFQEFCRTRGEAAASCRFIVSAMTADRLTIADPTDSRMLDIAGFDTAIPHIIAEFSAAAC